MTKYLVTSARKRKNREYHCVVADDYLVIFTEVWEGTGLGSGIIENIGVDPPLLDLNNNEFDLIAQGKKLS